MRHRHNSCRKFCLEAHSLHTSFCLYLPKHTSYSHTRTQMTTYDTAQTKKNPRRAGKRPSGEKIERKKKRSAQIRPKPFRTSPAFPPAPSPSHPHDTSPTTQAPKSSSRKDYKAVGPPDPADKRRRPSCPRCSTVPQASGPSPKVFAQTRACGVRWVRASGVRL